ncbi:hypothetical protein [Agaribacterium sp. ZY112]|uniref:hypothetical protein n=1 Tax=Agaribacterium sp. ZY112 TaxID=3233574 RepID=UPI00352694BA
MNELTRMNYLDAMGIASFVPRRLLTNGTRPRLCVLPLADSPDSESGHHAESSAASAAQIAAGLNGEIGAGSATNSEESLRPLSNGLNSVLENFGDLSPRINSTNSKPKTSVTQELAAFKPMPSMQQQGPQASSTVPSVSQLPAAQQVHSTDKQVELDTALSQLTEASTAFSRADTQASDALNTASEKTVADNSQAEPASFQLALYTLSQSYQILDSQQEGDALPTHALLSKILAARFSIAHLPSMELQRWPIPGSPSQFQSWQAASDMMFDFFDSRFQKHQPKGFILWGEDAAKLILGSSVPYSELCFAVHQSDVYGLPALVLPSLRAFLYEPELKKKLWSSLALLPR